MEAIDRIDQGTEEYDRYMALAGEFWAIDRLLGTPTHMMPAAQEAAILAEKQLQAMLARPTWRCPARSAVLADLERADVAEDVDSWFASRASEDRLRVAPPAEYDIDPFDGDIQIGGE